MSSRQASSQHLGTGTPTQFPLPASPSVRLLRLLFFRRPSVFLGVLPLPRSHPLAPSRLSNSPSSFRLLPFGTSAVAIVVLQD
ncbi:Hypothetical protein NTJ_03789 [Nesidiocoris tenuis]|uniref:Uncharacterized protein n=1 Tax=Nesidiocoris tenuis TaxID=355587 RepID=A0ABN7AFB7_9HEMI|nr:Hypothetical protein NTJ_03789 [Nesidiocoris tenuis]